ncbi:MAG: tetratricopeptide repeat protein [Myxococcota bacterium]
MNLPRGPLSTAISADLGMGDDGVDIDINQSMVTSVDALKKDPNAPAANKTLVGMPPVTPPPAVDHSLPPMPAAAAPVSAESVGLTPAEEAAPAPASAWPGAQVATAPPAPAQPVSAPLPAVPGTIPPPPTPPTPEEAARWQEAITSYEREAKALGTDKRAAPLWFEIGRTFEERLLQPRQAAAAYQQAFKTDPAFVPVIHAARRLFQDINNWAMVVTLLDAELAVERLPRVRAGLLVERGRILESKLNKAEDAFTAYKNAFEADPAFQPALDAVCRILRARNNTAEIGEVLSRAVKALPEGASRAERGLEYARLLEAQLGDVERAVQVYAEVLSVNPGATAALQALERLYARLGRHEELINVLTRLWEASPNPEETASVPLAVARVMRYALNDDARAMAILERARHRTPRDAAILRALAEVYAAAGRHQEHVEVLLALATSAKDEKQRVALHFEAGNILEERLKDEAGAIAQYKAVVLVNPRFLPAVQALGRLFHKGQRWTELASMYEAEVAALEEPSQKVPRLFKLAELRADKLQDEEGAAACYREIIQLAPGYLPALKALGALFAAHNRWEELIQLYEDEVKETADRDQMFFLLDKIASIWDEKLGRLDQAIETYERILRTAPNHLPAIRNLGQLFVRAERWRDLVRINSMEAELTQDQKQLVALLHKNGEILEEKENDVDGAISSYKKALLLSPSYLPTLRALGRLYSQRGAWTDLISMYRQEADVTRQRDHRVSLLFKVAEICEERLQDRQKAINAYREVLGEKADHHPSIRALMRLFLAAGDYAGLVEMAQAEALVFSDPLEQAHALYQAGEILSARLGRPAEAAALFQRALTLHPTFDAALSALVELASASGDIKAEHEALKKALEACPPGPRWLSLARGLAELLADRMNEPEAAARLYEQILERDPADLTALRGALRLALRRKDWARSISMAERLAPLEPETDAAAALYLQVASWKTHHVEPAQDPIPSYLKVLEYNPGDPVALRAVERAYRKAQAWEGLYQLYDRERSQATDPVRILDLCMRMADLATFSMKKDEEAVVALEKALKADSGYMPALRRLEPLYEKLGRHSDKLQLLAMEAEATKDPARAFSTLLEVARLQEEKFNNIDAAVDCYFRLLDRDPRHPQAQEKLDAILEKHQKWDKLVELLGRRAAFTNDTAQKSDLLFRSAQLMVQRLGRGDDAISILSTLIRAVPNHAPAVQLLAELQDAANRFPEAAQAYTVLLQLNPDPNLAGNVHKRLAQIFHKKLPDPARAAQHYAAALAAKPTDLTLAGDLTELYLSQRAWPQAAEMLAALAERDPDTEARAEHLLKLAQVMEEGFQDGPRAAEAYRRILELKPDHQLAVEKLVDLYERLGDFAGLAHAYTSMIQQTAKSDKPRLAALHMRLALLYLQRLNAADRAMGELKLVLESDPENVDARVILASLYARNPGTYGVAMEEHKRVLLAQPWRLESYHDLARIYDALRQRDRQFVCCEVLHFFKRGDEGEEFFYGDNKSKVRQDTEAVLSAEDHEALVVHPKERGPVRQIIKALAPELHKVFPVDLASFGVGKAERLPPKNTESLRKLCDGLMRTLGGALTFDVYANKTKTMDLAIASADPPSVIIGTDVVKRHQTREQRFIIGQRLEGLYSGHQILEGMQPAQLQQFISAACLAVDERFPVDPQPELLDLSKKISKAMSRATKKLLHDPVAELMTAKTRWDPAAFLRATRFTRMRAGVALSNDIEVVLRLTAREVGVTLNPQDMADTEKKLARDEFRELLQFILSDEYATLRNRLKFSVES